ncbi:MAG: ankyrin repeat domain-containing protein [Planctomycetia bacterium]
MNALQLAILEEDGARVEALAKDGADLDRSDPVYGSPLVFAICSDVPKMIEKLLDLGAKPNGGKGVAQPLHEALQRGNEPIVRLLLDRGADPNAPGEFGESPLCAAVVSKKLTMARLLLDRGADPLLQSKQGGSALTWAENDRLTKFVALFREHVDKKPAAALSLMDAAKFGKADRVRELLPAASMADRRLALVEAISEGHVECVRLLIEGIGTREPLISPRLQTSLAWPPLCHALMTKQDAVVALLLELGADANQRVDDPYRREWTPLHWAAEAGSHVAAQHLLAAGADPNARNADGAIPLEIARAGDRKRVVKLLESRAEAGADRMTLSEAVRTGQLPRVKALLAAGASVATPDADGRTPFVLAAHQGKVPLVEALVQAGAAKDLSVAQQAEVWRAALRDHPTPELVRVLAQAGLDANARIGLTELSPMHHAMGLFDKKGPPVWDSLVEAGADLTATYSQPVGAHMIELHQRNGWPLVSSPITLEVYARQIGNSKAKQYLREKAGLAADAYDRAKVLLKSLAEPTPEFTALAKSIGKGLKASVYPWKKRKGVYALGAAAANVEAHLAEWQAHAASEAATLIVNRPADSSGDQAGLLLFATREPAAVLTACGTNGVNAGHDTRAVVVWFDETSRRWPFTIRSCGFDYVEVVFQTPLADPAELNEQVNKFCPDGSEDSTESVEADGRCYFWWD